MFAVKGHYIEFPISFFLCASYFGSGYQASQPKAFKSLLLNTNDGDIFVLKEADLQYRRSMFDFLNKERMRFFILQFLLLYLRRNLTGTWGIINRINHKEILPWR